MRQIAQRAHVGLGAPRAGQPLAEQLLAVFSVHYRWLATQPALARILLQELTFYSSGKQAATFHGIRQRLIDGVEALVRAAQQRKEIRTKENPALIARHIFFVYSASLRWWIAAPKPDPQAGVADLRRLLKLQIDGLR